MQGTAQDDLQPLRPPPEIGNGPSEQRDEGPLLPAAAAAAARAAAGGGSWSDDRGRSTLLINVASVMERVDEQVGSLPEGEGCAAHHATRHL